MTQLKTETRTLPKHRAGIPLHTMTTVMQDAVRTCQSLSIRYLWIDALCIVQDDAADWEAESKTMGSVYRVAHVVLCAAASTTCHKGFLIRAPRVRIPYHSPLRVDVRGSYALVARGEWYLGAPEAPITQDTQRTSWGQRGWVFQERMLSTRRIIFGENMIHFECGQFVISEKSQPSDEKEGSLSEEMLAVAEMIHKKTLGNDKTSKEWRERLYHLFHLSVGRYSTSLLTFETYRLPAFSGMAEIVSDGTGDTYLAGPWRGDLKYSLL